MSLSNPVTVYSDNSVIGVPVVVPTPLGSALYGRVRIEVQGAATIFMALTRHQAGTPVFIDPNGGVTLWGGGDRDSLELTILNSGEEDHTDYATGGIAQGAALSRTLAPPSNWAGPSIRTNTPYVPAAVPSYSQPTWRGGAWSTT
jgi:hypothetical protein